MRHSTVSCLILVCNILISSQNGSIWDKKRQQRHPCINSVPLLPFHWGIRVSLDKTDTCISIGEYKLKLALQKWCCCQALPELSPSLWLILIGCRFGFFFRVYFGLGWGIFGCWVFCVCVLLFYAVGGFLVGWLVVVFCCVFLLVVFQDYQLPGVSQAVLTLCILFLQNWYKANRAEKVLLQGDGKATAPLIHPQMLTAWRRGNRGSCPSGGKKGTACAVTSASPDREIFPFTSVMDKLDPKILMCLRIPRIPTLPFHRGHQQSKLSPLVQNLFTLNNYKDL